MVVQWSSFVYGKSVNGHDLIAYESGHGPSTILVIGGFHGDEANSVPTVHRMRMTAIPRESERLVFIECANPDGLELRTRTNANQIDLNRNFDSDWAREARAPRYYPGEKPLSEPETVALNKLVTGLKPIRALSVHTPLDCVNFDGPGCEDLAIRMSLACGAPVMSDIGYPTPGSFGRKCEALGIPLITLELTRGPFEKTWSKFEPALRVFLSYPD